MVHVPNYALAHIVDQLVDARIALEAYGEYVNIDSDTDFKKVESALVKAIEEIGAVLDGRNFSDTAQEIFMPLSRRGSIDQLIDDLYHQLENELNFYGESLFEKANKLFMEFTDIWLNVQPKIESHIIRAFTDN